MSNETSLLKKIIRHKGTLLIELSSVGNKTDFYIELLIKDSLYKCFMFFTLAFLSKSDRKRRKTLVSCQNQIL